MNNKTILWRQWQNPLIDPDDNDDDDDSDTDEEIEDIDEEHHHKYHGTVLVGPMGILPITEHNDISKSFNFWVGHTNFNLDQQVVSTLENVEGVETLDIMTRYRFRVAIGQVFDTEDVLTNIENALQLSLTAPVPQPVNNLDMLKLHLNSKYKYWAIFILPDNELDYKTGETQDSVQKKIATYPKKAKVLASWELTKNNETEQKKNSH